MLIWQELQQNMLVNALFCQFGDLLFQNLNSRRDLARERGGMGMFLHKIIVESAGQRRGSLDLKRLGIASAHQSGGLDAPFGHTHPPARCFRRKSRHSPGLPDLLPTLKHGDKPSFFRGRQRGAGLQTRSCVTAGETAPITVPRPASSPRSGRRYAKRAG